MKTKKKAAARLGRYIRKATGIPFPVAMKLGQYNSTPPPLILRGGEKGKVMVV